MTENGPALSALSASRRRASIASRSAASFKRDLACSNRSASSEQRRGPPCHAGADVTRNKTKDKLVANFMVLPMQIGPRGPIGPIGPIRQMSKDKLQRELPFAPFIRSDCHAADVAVIQEIDRYLEVRVVERVIDPDNSSSILLRESTTKKRCGSVITTSRLVL